MLIKSIKTIYFYTKLSPYNLLYLTYIDKKLNNLLNIYIFTIIKWNTIKKLKLYYYYIILMKN